VIFWRPPFGIYILLTDSGLFPWSLRSSSLFLGIFAEYLRLRFPLSCRLSSLFSHTLSCSAPSILLFFLSSSSLLIPAYSFHSFLFSIVLCALSELFFLEYLPLVVTALPASSLPRHPQLSPSHSPTPTLSHSIRLFRRRETQLHLERSHRAYPGTPSDRSTVPGRSDPLNVSTACYPWYLVEEPEMTTGDNK
jgi:hypothetical protein